MTISKDGLFSDIKNLILEAKSRVAVTVNSELTQLYWSVGNRIKTDVLKDTRAEYGKKIVKNLSKQLTQEFGRGWSEKQLRHCLRTVETFPDKEILSTLWRELSWSHIKTFIYIDNELKREFYIEMCKHEHWSVRQLDERIDSMLFERTAISKKPEELIKKELKQLKDERKLSTELAFKDPYLLDFLGLKDTYSEKDLENAILAELQSFITELGSDFAFLARQKRITIDSTDYYIDLLFYHRNLRRLIVIELKLGKFKPEHKGQIELYLRWLDKYERREGEESPIGLILCSEGNSEHVELLMLEGSNIKVAQYLTELPEKEVIEKRLQRAIALAKNKI